MFIATIFSSLGVILTELALPDPAVKAAAQAHRETRPMTVIEMSEE